MDDETLELEAKGEKAYAWHQVGGTFNAEGQPTWSAWQIKRIRREAALLYARFNGPKVTTRDPYQEHQHRGVPTV